MTATLPTAMPAPDRTARDEFGRLVAVSWFQRPDGSTDRSNCWLVAVDGSEGSLRAASVAARLITADARSGVDLIHVHPWLVKEAAEEELARRGWHVAAAARALMDEAGIPWCLHVRMGEPAGQIVALAQELGSLGIAIGSHGLTATESLLLGSVAHKVVHLGRGAVLVVR